MSIKSLIWGTIIGEIFFIATKVAFFHYLNIDNFYVKMVFFILIILETIAIIRRMGVINYIESIFLMVVWLLALMFADIVVTSTLIGRDFYSHLYYWFSVLAVLVTIFLFHKALHVEVRKSNAKK